MTTEAVPVLFTVDGSSRHELILISPKHATLEGTCAEIVSLAQSSPNCAEFMGKYKKGPDEGEEEAVTELRVKWNGQSHDPKIFPASTVVTDRNFEAVIRMIGASGVGRDVLEVRMGRK